jgi:hypothetical protein
MTKLPEPEGRICFDGGDWEEDFVSSQDAYSEEQMLQFRRDALDEAIKVCTDAAKPPPLMGQTDEQWACSWCADAISKLKETT